MSSQDKWRPKIDKQVKPSKSIDHKNGVKQTRLDKTDFRTKSFSSPIAYISFISIYPETT
jgi:hypothetical protein